MVFVECLKALGHMERAAESYAKVVDLAPLHLDARISLSTLQQQLGRPEKALEALEPMYDPDTLAQDANAAQQVGKMFCASSLGCIILLNYGSHQRCQLYRTRDWDLLIYSIVSLQSTASDSLQSIRDESAWLFLPDHFISISPVPPDYFCVMYKLLVTENQSWRQSFCIQSISSCYIWATWFGLYWF